MSRFHSYISSAVKIIGTYDGSKPLMYHLKTFFAAEKKYGSRDRKTIASLCYTYFRLGQASKDIPAEERILTGLFLSENKHNDILALLRPAWNEQVCLPVSEKLSLLKIVTQELFPLSEQLGSGIDKEAFASSFFTQPDLYVRIRPGRKKQVADKLSAAAITNEELSEYCIKLPHNTPLDTVLKINKDAVIQDYNSQQVLHYLQHTPHFFPQDSKPAAWDCCAASGGKSILLHDVLKGKLKLTVSDIRENILANLDKRLQDAGINIYRKFIADLSKQSGLLSEDHFSIILCDAPCTGSGTWGRTPEQLYYFKEETIRVYADRQKKIVANIIPHLEKNGLLFYITCSVFKQENEEVVEYIKEKFHLPLLQMEYLKGYDKKADTMFVAVFKR